MLKMFVLSICYTLDMTKNSSLHAMKKWKTFETEHKYIDIFSYFLALSDVRNLPTIYTL